MYQGIIIEESLVDRSILDLVEVIGTDIEQVTEGFKTPWLQQWTLRTIRVPELFADEFAERLSRAIETEHTNWFADFHNESTHYIVFPGKVFVVDRSKPADYDAPRQYGITRGIPAHQLEFPTQPV
jgi:hypothetical protein